ncbi:hypothetical protein SAMN04488127_2263 [Bhargavaea ginsengi]|uniref:Uncharacterized protein n=1 Tax=Bhargavaea ginsengi TaxID=426757 RepID=A0A1H7A8I0_9BACL|nr:hypothetical protein [Bhargavaea ginsengi]SEJ60764.1 hypothetical protein SAMN04488127_2263 [Bhargavaea ginsengi]
MAERDGGPLLFVDAPPVYFVSEPVYSREAVEEEVLAEEEVVEESTSVYELPKRPEETARLLTQLRFLSRPFQREVYRPIQFRLKDGTVINGEILNLEESKVAVKGINEEKIEMELSIDDLDAIWWKGKPFPY